jgi:hypothetical protein
MVFPLVKKKSNATHIKDFCGKKKGAKVVRFLGFF